MKATMRRRAAANSVSRKLELACSALRWVLPAGAGGWLLAQTAIAQTYDPIASDIQITHTAGIGVLSSINNAPFLTTDVPGVIGINYTPPAGTTGSLFPIFTPSSPAGSYQLINTFTNPPPCDSGYSFPTGGPLSTTAFAGVGETGGLGGNTSLVLVAGSGLTQTNPNGIYPYASELNVNVNNLVFATPLGFPFPPGGFGGITYAFPVGGVLAASASATFAVNLNYTYYATTNAFSPSLTGIPIGSIQFSQTYTNPSPTQTMTFSSGNAGAILLNGGAPLPSPGFIDVTGTVDFQSIVDSQPTDGSGAINSFSFTQDATTTAGAQSGVAFAATGNTDLSQSGAWGDITTPQGQILVSGPPGTQDIAQFSSGILSGPTAFNLNAAANYAGLAVQNPGGAVTIISGAGSNTLTIGKFGITIAQDANGVSQDLNLAAPVALAAAQTWSVVGGQTLSVSGPSLLLGTNNLSVAGAGNAIITAAISGPGGLTMNGTGTLILSGANSLGGGITLNGGEVSVATDANLGGTAAAVAFNRGILQVTGAALTNLNSHAVNWNNFSGGFDIQSASNTFTVSQNIGNAATDSGSLTKLGAGTLVLSGHNTYFGPTTIGAGALRITQTSTLNPASPININAPRALLLSNGVVLANPISINYGSNGSFISLPDPNDSATISGPVTAAPGAAYQLGFGNATATLTVTGVNTVGGLNQPVLLAQGNIVFAGNGSLTANLNGALPLILGTKPQALNLVVKGHANITNLGSGGANIGNNQPEAGTTITLQDQAALNAGPGNFELNNTTAPNATTTLNLNGGNLTAGGFTATPAQQVASTNTTVINFNGGVLTAAADNANFLPSATSSAVQLNVGAGGVIINTNGFNQTLNTPGGFRATGPADAGLTKDGAGQLILGGGFGASSYHGSHVINGGLLEFNSYSQLGTSSLLQVNAGGAVGENIVNGAGFADFVGHFNFASTSSGGLALSALFANQNFDYTNTGNGFNMAPISQMSLGAVAGAPVVFNGTITPPVDPVSGIGTYQLGGGGVLKLVTPTQGNNAIVNGGPGVQLTDGVTGATNVRVENGGTVWLSTANTYTGRTTIQGTNVLTIPAADSPTGANQFQLEQTTLEATRLTDGSSSLGNSTNSPANLVIDGGILQYVGAGETSRRRFTMGQNGATLDASGTGALALVAVGPEAFAAGVSGPITLTLGGSYGSVTSPPPSVNLLAGSFNPPSGVTLGLVKSGSGVWSVAGSNSFSSVAVNSGVLQLAGASATTLGSASIPVSIAAGGTLELNGNAASIGTLSGSGIVDNFSSGASSLLTVAAGTFDGAIQNSAGTMSLNVAGNVVLTGSSNSYSGPTTIFAGAVLTLAGGNGTLAATPVGTSNIADNGSLVINRSDSSLTIANTINGNGSVTVGGPGTVTFLGINGYTGPTIINGGTLQITNNNALGSGSMVINGGLLDLHGNSPQITNLSGYGAVDNLAGGSFSGLNNTSLVNTTFHGVIANSGGMISFNQTGPGTLVLTGNNTYGGGTSISNGALAAEGLSPTGTGAVLVGPGGMLTGTGTIAGDVSVGSAGTIFPGDGGVGTLGVKTLSVGQGSVVNFDFNLGDGSATGLNTIAAASGVTFAGPTQIQLTQLGTNYGFDTPGTYVLFQVAGGAVSNLPSLTVANPEPLTSYTFSGVANSTGLGTNVQLIVQNTAPVYAFDYGAIGKTRDQNSNPILGHFNGDLTAATNWYNLSVGAPQLVGHGPGAGDIAQFDSTYGNLSGPVTFSLSQAAPTALAGISVQSPGPAQFVSAGVTSALVMTISGVNSAKLMIAHRGISVAGTDTVISAPVILTDNQTWNVSAVNPIINGTATASQALTVSGPLDLSDLGPDALVFSGSGNITISGGISGGAASGIATAPSYSGTLTLISANHLGGTGLRGGTISVSSSAGLGAAGGAVNFLGGTLQVTAATMTDLNSNNVNGAGAGGNATWADFPLNLDINNVNNTFTVSQNLTGNLSLTKTGAGALLLSGSNTYSGGTIIDAGTVIVPTLASLGTGPVVDGGGTLMLTANDSPGQSLTNNGTLAMTGNTVIGSITGTGTATVAGAITFYTDQFIQHNLVNNGITTIGCGGNVNKITGTLGSLTVGTSLMAGNLVMNANSGLSTQAAISIHSGDSRLDITNNALAINFGAATDPLPLIKSYLTTGYNGDKWTGLALTSSMAALNPGVLSVGYADGNTDVGTAAHANQILVVYTLAGDTNLDGSVGFADLLVVAQNYGKTGKDWVQGNLNYDPAGSVGFADLLLVAQLYGAPAISVASAPVDGLSYSPAWELAHSQTQSTSITPEPAAMTLMTLAGAGLLARRRRARPA